MALVTGGLSGIGLHSALALAGRGVDVAAVSSRGDSDLYADARKQLATIAQANGRSLLVLGIDVRDPKGIEEGIDEITTRLGPIGILVNAAGTYHHELISDHTLDGWLDTISVNLTGPFLTTRACWASMLAAGYGRIINIASTAAHLGMQQYSGYCAAKSGLLGLTRVTALEGAPHGITCNSVSPSWVDTPMMARSLEAQAGQLGVETAELYEDAIRQNPQGRIISADEIAAQVAWLALDAPPSLTGEDILMTGGARW